ncbi:MAG TPA: Gfo/Idh/MocA family oxidoreductase [Pirellulales bacterium]|nr:Gfo/Idh/MocA family oxidoreductase [Pirellulales bacterium]
MAFKGSGTKALIVERMALRTILVGCGAVAGTLYRKPLQELERQSVLRVVALVDSKLDHAEAMRSRFRSASVWNDLALALQSQQPDLTLILSPPHLHCDQAVLALEHQSHVLCEKPMAASTAQCAEMIRVARESKRVLAIGMIRRFFPAFAQLKTLLDTGELGEIRSFCYREGRVFDWDVRTPALFARQPSGGAGLLFDIGSHALDYLHWLFGDLSVVSYADDGYDGVEANALLELAAPSCRGRMQLSWDSPLLCELRVTGTKGEAILRVDHLDKLAVKWKGDFQEVAVHHCYPADVRNPSLKAIAPRLYAESIYCQLIQLVRAIELAEAPAVDGVQGQACVSLIEAARRRARPLDVPWLDPEQQAMHQALHWTNA